MQISNTIRYIGVDHRGLDLFEGQYPVPNGISYNSYIILDEAVAVMDTVDKAFTAQWLQNLAEELGERRPDYLIVQHMEPDHSASIAAFADRYPEAKIVASAQAFRMIGQFFGTDYPQRQIVVTDGKNLSLGGRELTFFTAPMVHWPEVIVTYDSLDRVLFSADGFGKFGTPDCNEEWADEARRYYFGIVGKFGPQVQALLKKASGLDLQMICPLHGPVLRQNLSYYLDLYDRWSRYQPEEGVTVAYTSIYGNTAKAVERLVDYLKQEQVPVAVYDLARCDISAAVSDAFRYRSLVLATTTYNGDIFPYMDTFIRYLTQRNYQNRTVGLIQNGSWAPVAAKGMTARLAGCKDLTIVPTTVTLLSALHQENEEQLKTLAKEVISQ